MSTWYRRNLSSLNYFWNFFWPLLYNCAGPFTIEHSKLLGKSAVTPIVFRVLYPKGGDMKRCHRSSNFCILIFLTWRKGNTIPGNSHLVGIRSTESHFLNSAARSPLARVLYYLIAFALFSFSFLPAAQMCGF